MNPLSVKSNFRNYTVFFGNAKIHLRALKKKHPEAFYIIDRAVWDLYKGSFFSEINPSKVITLKVSEKIKNLDSVQKLYGRLMGFSAKRNMTIISIGGGILQDVTGFLASTLYRGVRWIFFPTTLLAQTDSCIGSKTSLNYKNFKNLVGTFYPPESVFVDADFLTTQKNVDFLSGLGELVKLHIMGGEKDTQGILRNLAGCLEKDGKVLRRFVSAALKIKRDYIENDEFDSGRRNLLNYGHCFGHAIETVSDFEVPHGQAVVVGMMLANSVARRRKLLSPETEAFVLNELLSPILSRKLMRSAYLRLDALVAAMKKDKKRIGRDLPLIMLTDHYKMVKVSDLKVSEVVAAVNSLLKLLSS